MALCHDEIGVLRYRRASASQPVLFRTHSAAALSLRFAVIMPTARSEMTLSIRNTDLPLGADIHGADLSHDLDADTFGAIKRALDERSVIVLREQRIAPAEVVRFAQRFGELLVHAHNKFGLPGCPQLSIISNIVEDGRQIGVPDAGLVWHTDGSYLDHPDMYSFLHGIEIPEQGGRTLGNTLYASTTAAYDALPDATRRRIDGRTAMHSFAHHSVRRAERGGTRIELTDDLRKKIPDVEQPMVRIHPVTGRRCLYVSEGHTTHVVGMAADESAALLAELWAHLRGPGFVYRHVWRTHDLLVWDNCATQHLATRDYELPLRRRMHRTATRGETPVGLRV
jgi:taurine dioxygenase